MIFSCPAGVDRHDALLKIARYSTLFLAIPPGASDARLGRTRKSLFLDGHYLIYKLPDEYPDGARFVERLWPCGYDQKPSGRRFKWVPASNFCDKPGKRHIVFQRPYPLGSQPMGSHR